MSLVDDIKKKREERSKEGTKPGPPEDKKDKTPDEATKSMHDLLLESRKQKDKETTEPQDTKISHEEFFADQSNIDILVEMVKNKKEPEASPAPEDKEPEPPKPLIDLSQFTPEQIEEIRGQIEGEKKKHPDVKEEDKDKEPETTPETKEDGKINETDVDKEGDQFAEVKKIFEDGAKTMAPETHEEKVTRICKDLKIPQENIGLVVTAIKDTSALGDDEVRASVKERVSQFPALSRSTQPPPTITGGKTNYAPEVDLENLPLDKRGPHLIKGLSQM